MVQVEAVRVIDNGIDMVDRRVITYQRLAAVGTLPAVSLEYAEALAAPC